jgi:hypothetical protein
MGDFLWCDPSVGIDSIATWGDGGDARLRYYGSSLRNMRGKRPVAHGGLAEWAGYSHGASSTEILGRATTLRDSLSGDSVRARTNEVQNRAIYFELRVAKLRSQLLHAKTLRNDIAWLARRFGKSSRRAGFRYATRMTLAGTSKRWRA